jgi:hypothetical protein
MERIYVSYIREQSDGQTDFNISIAFQKKEIDHEFMEDSERFVKDDIIQSPRLSLTQLVNQLTTEIQTQTRLNGSIETENPDEHFMDYANVTREESNKMYGIYKEFILKLKYQHLNN